MSCALLILLIRPSKGLLYFCGQSFFMYVMILLIAVSILVAGGFLAAFLWSVKNGQYDDDYTPSVRMLFDDQPPAQS